MTVAPETGATELLAAELAARPARHLPPSVVTAAKEVILDGLGCLVAGAREPAGEIAISQARAAGGLEEATLVGVARKVDAASAAFANGVAMHALDFEAVGTPPCHATSSVLPALLALAERGGRSGAAVIEAFVIGWEVECRLRTAGSANPRFHPTGVYGPVAAAAASAVLLGLDATSIENAIGIAASSAGGLAANGIAMVKTAHAGNAARAGVTAALLAGGGFTSAKRVLERSRGYGDTFLVDPDWVPLAASWGERWFIVDPGVNYKPYPVQFPMLNVVDAALDAVAAGARADSITAIDITASPKIAGRSNPRPHGGHGGKFSPEYCAAVALLRGAASIEDFTDERAADPVLVAMIDRCTVTARPPGDGGEREVSIRIEHGDRSEITVTRTSPRGTTENPLTREEHHAKLQMCLRTAGRDAAAADRLADLSQGLESSDDLLALAEFLRG